MAYNRASQSVFMDAERTQLDLPSVDATTAANMDMQKLGKSILQRGLLSDRSPRFRTGYMTENLLLPYLEAVNPNSLTMNPDDRQAAIQGYWTQVAIAPEHINFWHGNADNPAA